MSTHFEDLSFNYQIKSRWEGRYDPGAVTYLGLHWTYHFHDLMW